MKLTLLFKKLPLLVFFLACWGMNGQVTLYTEDFSTTANDNTGGYYLNNTLVMGSVTKWTVSALGGTVDSNDRFVQKNGRFEQSGVSITTTLDWISNSINISGYGSISISADLVASASISTNGIKALYQIDGGSWVAFGDMSGNNVHNAVGSGTWSGNKLTITGLGSSNTSLKVKFEFRGTSDSATYYIDNVLVQGTLSCVTPTVPAVAASGTKTASSFVANWSASTGTVTDYLLYVSTDSAFGSFVTGYNGLAVGNVTTYTVNTNLTEKTQYYYRVKAQNTSSCISSYTDNTAVANATTLCSTPGTPTSSAASSITSTGFTTNWSAASGTVTGYLLDVATDSGFTSLVSGFNALSVGNVVTYAVTGLSSSTAYYYRVRAINTGSCTGSNSSSQNPTTLAACTTPGLPGSVTASGQTTTGLTVNWTAGSGTVTGYQVDVATDSGFTTIVYTNAAIASGATSQAATGLLANTTYYIRVKTLNGGCSSAFTATTTTTTACQAPAAQATSLSFNTVTTTSLNGSFTASASATGYLVLRSTSGTAPSPAPVDGTTYTAGGTVGGATVVQAGSGTTFSDSGLTINTTYYYYIYAYNTGCYTTIDYLQTSPLNASQATTNTRTFYVNDNSTTGDIYCTAIGNNANSGLTTALPKADLQSAITAANTGDIIYVDTGTWVSTSTQTINKALTIYGAGAASTIFESGSVSGTVRWGDISASNILIKDVQISKYDKGADGIAISITSGTNIIFDHCIIYNNVGSAGQGAVYISGAATSVTIKNTSLPCNRTSVANYGGAMNINGSTVSIENCSMNNNVISALKGGALLIQGSTANVTITKTTFDSNGASQGGAIAVMDGTVSISNSCFDSNVAGGDAGGTGGGGAILISPTSNSTTTITNCSFSNNTATNASSDGGAICFSNYSSPTVTATVSTCSFTNNASRNGEDINFNKQNSPTYSVTLKNNTFNTIATGVNLYNTDFDITSIKFEGLSSPSGTGGCGDIVADGSGIAITKPEMSGTYTESSSSIPTSLPSTTCNDRFDGDCGSVDATFTCLTQNTWNGSTWSRSHIPTIYEYVILNANYNTTTHGNIDACVLTVNSGYTLTIANDDYNTAGVDTKGTYVYVVNSIINNGTINVYNNGNLIQVNHPLDLDNITIITPTINLTKTTPSKYRWDYVYWSKPFASSSSIISNFTTAFDLMYYWDPDYSITIDRSYEGWRTLSGEPTVGTGFITRVKNSAPYATTATAITIGPMTGLSTNGDYTATVKYYDNLDTKFRNFTLLGNPYPGAIYFQDFYNDNSDKIYGTAYLWSSFTQYSGAGEYRDADYATFNLTGGVGTPATGDSVTPNGYIPSGQAFMVRPKVNGTVTFKNAHRTKVIPSNNQFYRSIAPEDKNRFWLRLTDSNKRYSEQLIGYVDGSSTGFDEAYDGPINSLTKLKFYSFFENQKLIIQGNGDFNENDNLRIGYSKTMIQNEILTISISKGEGVFSYNTKVYVFDKELNQYHNLSNRPYQFIASTNTENRFEIVYKLPDSEEINTENNNVVVSIDNQIMTIAADTDIDKVILYDVTGKLVFEKTMDRKSNVVNTPVYISTGVYIAKVTLSNTKTHTLKLIKK